MLALNQFAGVLTSAVRAIASGMATQDWGRHEILYGLAGHTGDWRREQSDWQAWRLEQPLIAFTTASHEGALGKSFSLLNLSSPRVRVLAIKKAEGSDDIIVRLVEPDGRHQQNLRLAFAAPIGSAREVNGQEQPLGTASVDSGELILSFTPYQVRTFAVKLARTDAKLTMPHFQPVVLACDQATAGLDATKSNGGFDDAGRTFPAEMLPSDLVFGGIRFRLAPALERNAVVARGQIIALPDGKFTRLFLLAAADGDQKGVFYTGEKTFELTVQDWSGYIGQWDKRVMKEAKYTFPYEQPGFKLTVQEYESLTPGYIKRTPVAWFASHRHTSDGANEAYAYSYLFAYELDLMAGVKTLRLPNNEKIRVLAVTVSGELAQAFPAQPLYDTLDRTGKN